MKLDGVPDVSRFIRRTDKVPLNNTVKLILGEVEIEANGLVLALKSKVLEEIVSTQREIFLDNFVGEEEGVQDVLEMLYGADIEITMANIKTIMKFGVIYNVDTLYGKCFEWLRERLADNAGDLYEAIQLAILIETIDKDQSRWFTEHCRRLISEAGPDKLWLLSRDWDFKGNISFIKFLVHADILHWTLPILIDWIKDDSGIRLVLDQIELKNLTRNLSKTGQNSDKLMQKMNERVHHEDLSKRVLEFQLGLGCKPSYEGKLEHFLLNYLMYCSTVFSTEDILLAEDEYSITHFDFVDIILHWILSKCVKTQHEVDRLLSAIRRDEVNVPYEWYLGVIKRTLARYLDPKLKIYFPELNASASLQPEKLFIAKVTVWSMLGVDYDGHWYGEPLETEWECEKCATTCNTRISFINRGEFYCGTEPCYEIKSGFAIEHVYMINSKNDSKHPSCYFPLTTTTNYDLVRYKIKISGHAKQLYEDEDDLKDKELYDRSDEMFVFVYKCTGSLDRGPTKTPKIITKALQVSDDYF